MNTVIQHLQVDILRNCYRLHSTIYKGIRRTFLLGRKALISALQIPWSSDKTILEVGCGAGHNLYYLAKSHRNLRLWGLDISPGLLSIAAQKLKQFFKRVLFFQKPYTSGSWELPSKPDVILFSYCLTMINPGWESAIQRAADDLKEGGSIAVVDFFGSPSGIFRRWMGFNHVRMDQHLLPVLEKLFKTVHLEVHQAYGGLWTYFLFVGTK